MCICNMIVIDDVHSLFSYAFSFTVMNGHCFYDTLRIISILKEIHNLSLGSKISYETQCFVTVA